MTCSMLLWHSLALLTIGFLSISHVASGINWNGNNWAMGCDFPNNDLASVRSPGELCSQKCAEISRCTHFAWNYWLGGTCWLKHGSVSKNDAFSASDAGMMCGVLNDNTRGIRPGPRPPIKNQWKTVWEDDFNRRGAVDSSKWKLELGNGNNGWGNNEKQCYTSNHKNIRCERFPGSRNGRLIIEAHRESVENCQYTAARLLSRASWVYGRLQIRAKIPKGRGLWPALWMLPEKGLYGNGGWPDNGEIDLMEQVGYEPSRIVSSVHTHAYNHIKGTQKSGDVFVHDAVSSFKIYTLQWDADRIQTFVGNDADPFANTIFTYTKHGDWTKWPFNKPFFIVMNMAVGGNWGGLRGIDDSIFPRRMEIDWVRFQKRE